MAITRVFTQAKTTFASSSTSISVTIDASVATDDKIIIYYFCRSAATVPSGFTKDIELETGDGLGGRVGVCSKTSDGTEGGTNVTITQASAGRFEAAQAIRRSSLGVISASQTSTLDGGTTSSGTLPTLTESQAFIAISAMTNEFAAANVVGADIGAGADAEYQRLNTDVENSINANRLWGADAIYSGADTTTMEWDNVYQGASNADWGAVLVTYVEGSASVTVNVGAATETDTANTIASGQITVIVGTATESDAGNIVTPPTVKGASVTLYSGSTLQANITNITAMWWDASPPTGNPVFTTASASTDASGVLTVNLDSTTALPIGDPGHLSAYKLDGTDEKDSLAWQGQLLVEDIS